MYRIVDDEVKQQGLGLRCQLFCVVVARIESLFELSLNGCHTDSEELADGIAASLALLLG
jgi:hypothetical protein